MVIINAASQGLGTALKLVSEEATLRIEKVGSTCHLPCLCTDNIQLMFAADVFYVLALFWSKLSICLFFRRLSATTEKTLLADILAYACLGLSIISVFVIGLRQRIREPWVQGPVLGSSTVSGIPMEHGALSYADM